MRPDRDEAEMRPTRAEGTPFLFDGNRIDFDRDCVTHFALRAKRRDNRSKSTPWAGRFWVSDDLILQYELWKFVDDDQSLGPPDLEGDSEVHDRVHAELVKRLRTG